MALIRKRYWYPSRRDRWRGLFRTTFVARSRVTGEAAALERLAELGLQPRLVLAIGEARSCGWLVDSFLCMVELDAEPLDQFLRSCHDADARDRSLAELARFVAAWHQDGVVDRDLHLRNFLRQRDGALAKIDSPFARRDGTPFRRRRQQRETEALAAEIEAITPAGAQAFRSAAGGPSCRG